jgi:LmbE family N-acetylglucosaminyl deacetylase
LSKKLQIPLTKQKTGLIVISHADDLLLSCGAATLALLDDGWKIHVIRVTDDRWDSWGFDEAETIRRNKSEFDEVLAALGINSLSEFGYPTDTLGDKSEVSLRNQIVKVIREIRPYLVMSFDPDSIKFEDNQDHILVGKAVAEACWTAGFDKHPDGKVDQLAPHLPIEKWYFGRVVVEETHFLDITDYRDRLIELISLHRTMISNMVAQASLQAEFLGYSLEQLRENPKIYVELLVRSRESEKYRIIGPERINQLIKEFGVEI